MKQLAGAWGRCSLALVGLIAASALSCQGRPRPGSYGSSASKAAAFFGTAAAKIVEIDLTRGAPEATGGGFFPMPATRTFTGLVRALERTAKDQDAKAVFVRIGEHQMGVARSQEVATLLADVRAAGKPVVCHAHGLDNASVWIAAAGCDRVWLSPAGEVSSVGIAAQTLYFKGALDKLKVKADFLHVGKFKSASEPFTREGPSDEAREALLFTLGSIRQSWLDGVEAGKKSKDARRHVEQGPWSPSEAKARGLVDEIGYESEALEDAKKRGSAERVTAGFGARSQAADKPDIGELIRILAGGDEGAAGRPHIALVVAEGAISMEAGGMLDSGGITAKALTKTLRQVAEDDSAKVVVLRIDSPGGSALASDLLWHELRELKKKKPIITSVGDMAASGGYYLACGTDRIVAEPTSIVGSIGVLGGKLAIDTALADYGVNTVVFPASPEPGAAARAAYLSPFMPWDDPTRDRVQKQMEAVYELFVARVAEGRNLPVPKVKSIAEGRIWSGTQGKERGLVDELGGLSLALKIAREIGKLDDRAPVELVGQKDSLFESLLMGDQADSRVDADAVAEGVRRTLATRGVLLTNVEPELRPFLSSLQPLLARETAVTAMPFAMVVR